MSIMSVDFYEKYCKSNKIAIDPNIKSALVKSSTSREVSLAGVTVSSIPNCEALGATITANPEINKLDLSNSMLSISGLCTLLDSLINSRLNALNLKGNNMYGNATLRLANLLSKNTSLKVLLLEWNNVGSPLQAFSKLCLSLINNHTLEVLDLKNNELNYDCATELADVILQNKSIKDIDLRWNNIGVEGGQRLLSALNSNKTLNVLRLQGNGIPSDMIGAIDNTVRHNSTISKINTECTARQNLFTRQIQTIQRQRVDDFKNACEQSVQQLQPCLDKMKQYSAERRKLVEDIEHGNIKILQLEEMVSCLRGQLEGASKQLESREAIISEHENTVATIQQQSQNEIETIKNKHLEEEKRLRQEIENFQSAIEKEKTARGSLENKLRDSQLSIDTLLTETKDLKDRLTLVTSMHNRVLEEERQIHQESLDRLLRELKAQQQASSDLLDKLKKESSEKIESLQNKLLEYQNSKQTINDIVLAERTKWNDERNDILNHAAENQAELQRSLTNQLNELKLEKEKLQHELTRSQASIKTILAENDAMKSEVSTYMSRISILQNKLTESKTTINHLQSDHSETSNLIDSFKNESDRYKKELVSARQLLSNLQLENTSLTDKYRKELSELSTKLQDKVEEIAKLRADEMERAHALYSAVNKYIGSKC